ncbi:nitrate- and nitrite sensing domain-containing protein [Kibdelosporangium philippinense]|uniref:histidine kinase n=1 Tax=Kibdelosporangium philippinense TaxID=211113 RepID=A0ABS8ZWY8_9PSEU|nr:nitrate- and nitrite sensing domain-containing protein [Kibdelosporangium philippinense]MCE7011126.1 nitrate- and nitrite sensing domain-containing protein [Kibdelosporangium philippinense]
MQRTDEDESGKPYDKSIRKRLTRTVLIPSVTLLVLWIAVSSYFFINGLYVRLVAASVREVSIPAATALAAFQRERQIALQYLDNPALGQSSMQEQQKATDEKLVALRSAFDATISNAPDEIATKVNTLKAQFEQLPVVRSQINFRSIDRGKVNDYYNEVLDTASDLFDTQARIVPDAQAAQGGITATSTFRAGDLMSRETSLVLTAFAAKAFTPDDFVQFTQLRGFYRTELGQIAPFLDPEVRAAYQALTTSDAWRQLTSAEDALIKRGPWTAREMSSVAVSEADWQKATNEVAQRLNEIAINQADKVSAAALESGNSQLRNAIVGSIFALLASLVAIIVAVRVSRSLVDRALMTRLARLRNDSLDLAQNRLPNIVDRLKGGEHVNVAEELPRLDHGRDEIGQVAEALNIAQLTAVNAAVSEAKARSGVHNVFLGIAHRNQVLVHRQLQILDEMEKREEDSSQLASLFQLDHLATRARRTTENLIILGGKQPGRRWRNPVPLLEVLRAAVSETEQYSRVRVEGIPEVAIVGSAVADTIHLIAELVDNGTSFSPPGSQVEVSATTVARGVVIEISDQGLGMKDAVREWANQMMSEAPEFDAMALRADTSLGLFVVARIASRLDITVTFDPSRYGGTRATVLIPTHILVTDGQAEETMVVSEPAPTAPPPAAAPLPPAPAPWPEPREADHSNGFLPRRADIAPRPHPVQPPPVAKEPVADQEPTPATDAPRAPLPQRRPQQNLVSQLRDDPAADTIENIEQQTDDDTVEYGQSRTLSAFHKGSKRGRESDVTPT